MYIEQGNPVYFTNSWEDTEFSYLKRYPEIYGTENVSPKIKASSFLFHNSFYYEAATVLINAKIDSEDSEFQNFTDKQVKVKKKTCTNNKLCTEFIFKQI